MRLWLDQSRCAEHQAKFDLVLEPGGTASLPVRLSLDASARAQLVDYSIWCQRQSVLRSIKPERLAELHQELVRMIMER
jgi:hypothetical protein